MATATRSVEEICRAAKDASHQLARADRETKDACLSDLAERLEARKQRVPIGVIGIVYEARPNVTIDAAALCLKSGNAVVLRGSSSAETSNGALAAIVSESLAATGLPEA